MAAAGGGLRREALSLYRQLLRAAAGKPGFAARIRQEFRRGAALPPRDRLRAEFLLRRGRRQLQQLRAPSTARMGVFGAPPGGCAAPGVSGRGGEGRLRDTGRGLPACPAHSHRAGPVPGGGAALTDARLRQRARGPRGTGGGGGDGGGGHGLVVGRRGEGGGGGAAEAAGGGAGGAEGVPVQPRPPPAPPSRRHRAGAGGRVAAAEGAGGRAPVLVPQRAPGHRHRRHLLRAERHRARRRLWVFHPGGPVCVLRGGLVPAEPGAAAAPHDAAGAHGRRQRRRRRAARPALALRPLPLRRAPRGRDRPRGAPPRAPTAPREVTAGGRPPEERARCQKRCTK